MNQGPRAMQSFFPPEISTEERQFNADRGHAAEVEPILQTQPIVVIQLVNYKPSYFAAWVPYRSPNLKLSY
jgi:hypothetical protein